MDANKSCLVSCSLYYYGPPTFEYPHPRDIAIPAGVINQKWVPQTLVESIWLIYEFDSPERRDEFMLTPPDVFAKATITKQNQDFFDKWDKGE